MDKFLFIFKLSKGAKIIGWFKFVVSCLFVVILLIATLWSDAVLETTKKTLNSGNGSSNWSE